MKRLLSVALVVCLAPVVHGADMENPFKKAKKGDYAEYKMTTSTMGLNIDGNIKQTVVDKDDTEATIEVTGEVSFMGNKMAIPAQKQKIDLTKPYDPTATANLPKGSEATVEKDGEGKE